MLESVDRVNLKFTDASRECSSRSSDNSINPLRYILYNISKCYICTFTSKTSIKIKRKGGYGLIGKIVILHIIVLGSSPGVSNITNK